MARIEFGQKVFRLRGFRLVEVPHDVSPLLPDVNGFLKLHFALHTDKNFRLVLKLEPKSNHTAL